jgi:hypothetical protein
MKAPPERLGSFYLGSVYDPNIGKTTGELVNYDARDLTTHAVCLGMTGSGKTGLCVCLLEEAAIDQVPAIIVDPKGDITNHLLHFPELKPQDFQPWVNLDDARRKGLTKEEYAEFISETWRKGLTDWGISSDRITLLKDTVDYTIYTPGSNSGIPVNILSSLKAPPGDFDENSEYIRDTINGLVGALLELSGEKKDPVRSREGILLSSIFEHYWRDQQDLTLEKLITNIQNPPFNKLGVFDLDTFFPEDKRLDLAMALNSLIASPNFREWLQGEPLDIPSILYTETGKPRHSIFYLAHLTEEERMFFVTLLLENVVNWIRQQPGTTSLRGLLYFDEVFGFMPPVSEPPSKKPLLTLLKQARAYGLGVVLVTQNPVDIDYKGLTNTGTWFIGRMQTERDKDRVLEGLRTAISEAGGSTDYDYDELIGSLKSRVFLLHNVHEKGPVIFHTRWAMNYLRGPLTRPQISSLMKEYRKQAVEPIQKQATKLDSKLGKEYFTDPPAIDPDIDQVFIQRLGEPEIHESIKEVTGNTTPEEMKLIYKPSVLAMYNIRFYNKSREIDEIENHLSIAPEPGEMGDIDWGEMTQIDSRSVSSQSYPNNEVHYDTIPDEYNSSRKIQALGKKLSNHLYYNSSLVLRSHKGLKLLQRPDESERDFLIRVNELAREKRDAEIDILEKKYAKQLDRLENKIEKMTRGLGSDKAELEERKRDELVGMGETVLGLFMGRRRTSIATTASRRRRMTSRVKRDIDDTKEEIEDLRDDYEKIEAELKEQVGEIKDEWEKVTEKIDEYEVKPRKTDVIIDSLMIAWVPYYYITYKESGMTLNKIVSAYQTLF